MAVSLYIPARNAEATLGRCLDAVARLEPAPDRVLVVVDESSRDATVQVARARPSAERVTVIAQNRPGLTAARNIALHALHDEWVAALDADVVVAPDWLGALLAARAQFPRAAAISGRTEEHIETAGDVWRALMHPHHWGSFPMDNPFMVVSDALFHRPTLLEIGGYRERLERYGDDSRISRDIRDAGFRLAYTPHARAAHIRTDTIASALDLRWSYAEPRLSELLEDLQGVLAKWRRNLEYGRLAIYRGGAAEVAELVLMGVLLPLHHVVRDLDSLLGRRWFMTPTKRLGAVQALRARVAQTAGAGRPAFAQLLARELTSSSALQSLDWPAWPEFVERVASGVEAWLEECAAVLEPALATAGRPGAALEWRRRFGAPEHTDKPGTEWPAPRSVSPWPERPGAGCTRAGAVVIDVDWPLAERLTVLHPSVAEASVSHDRALLWARSEGEVPAGAALIIPALQSFSAPRALLERVLPRARRVQLRYRPPARLGEGEVLLASDLAEACARASLGIDRFETQVGDAIIEAAR